MFRSQTTALDGGIKDDTPPTFLEPRTVSVRTISTYKGVEPDQEQFSVTLHGRGSGFGIAPYQEPGPSPMHTMPPTSTKSLSPNWLPSGPLGGVKQAIQLDQEVAPGLDRAPHLHHHSTTPGKQERGTSL